MLPVRESDIEVMKQITREAERMIKHGAHGKEKCNCIERHVFTVRALAGMMQPKAMGGPPIAHFLEVAGLSVSLDMFLELYPEGVETTEKDESTDISTARAKRAANLSY